MSLRIDMTSHGKVLLIRIKGELDHHTSEIVRRQIDETFTEEGCAHAILNLSELSFMDSSGLGVILGRYKRINQRGGTLAVCSLTPAVHKLFELSGMFKIVPAFEREDEAFQSLGVTL